MVKINWPSNGLDLLNNYPKPFSKGLPPPASPPSRRKFVKTAHFPGKIFPYLGCSTPVPHPTKNLEVTLLESTGFPRLGRWKEVRMGVWTWEMGVGADGASQQSEFHFSRLQEHPKTVTHFQGLIVLDKKIFLFLQ